MIVRDLIYNVALISVVVLASQYVLRRFSRGTLAYSFSAGCLFGLAAVFAIFTAFEYCPGVLFDGRTVILCVVGFWAGPVAALTAAIIALLFRVGLGGDGVVAGVLMIAESAAIGSFFHWLGRRGVGISHWLTILGMGMLVHIIMMGLLLAVPGQVFSQMVADLALPVLVVFPLMVLLVIKIFEEQESRDQAEQRLGESEERYRNLFSSNQVAMLIIDPKDGSIVDANPAAVKFYGWSCDELLHKSILEIDTMPEEKLLGKLKAACHGQTINQCFYHRLADSSVRNVEVFSGPIEFDGQKLLSSIIIDISEKRLVELALYDSEQRFRQFYMQAPIGYLTLDAGCVVLDANETLLKMLGVTDREHVVGHHAKEFLVPGLAEQFDEIYADFKEKGSLSDFEADMITQDGSIVTVLTEARIARTIDGAFDKGHCLFFDITERKKATEAIRGLSEKLNYYLDTSPAVIYVLDYNDGRVPSVKWISPNLIHITGYEAREADSSQWWEDVFDSADLERMRHIRMGLAQSGRSAQDYSMKKKDGSMLWVQDQQHLVYDDDGKPVEVVGIWTDITERCKVENRADHLNRVLLAVREINHLIVHDKDPESLIQNGCSILVKHRSYHAAIIVLLDESGHPLFFAQSGLPGQECELEKLIECGALPKCIAVGERQDGIHFHSSHSNICDDCPLQEYHEHMVARNIELKHGGRLFGYLSVLGGDQFEDNAEEMSLLAEVAGDIAYALDSLTVKKAHDDGEETRKKLEMQLAQAQKMEAVGRLAGGVAHDFNNMLQAINGYTGIALRLVGSDHKVASHLREIYKATERSADLTRHLLAFARKQPIEPKPLNLNDVIKTTLKMLTRLIGEDIKLTWKPTHDRLSIVMDPVQIDQILTNLVVNARDAIEGTGTIHIETQPAHFDGEYCRMRPGYKPGDYALLSVSDDGCGMDKITAAEIFEPFFTTKEKGKGTGLGLSTTYGIVTQNNGYITVYSEPGMGTTFKIFIPVTCNEAECEKIPEKEESLPGGSETVMLVEDELALLALCKSMLEHLGYTVLPFDNPVKALEVITEGRKIDLLMTDVIMPDMSGRDLWERISKTDAASGIQCLYMSGYTADIISHHGVLDEGVHFIHKPFSLEAVAKKIRETLEDE